MKKIVALVLSLVMVLGLATVATAAPAFDEDTTYYVLESVDTSATPATVNWDDVEFVPAEDNGDGTGNVAYFAGSLNAYYVVCEKSDDDALKLFSGKEAGDKLLGYVKAVATANYYKVGTKVAASAVADCDTDLHAKGYKTVDPVTGVPTYWVKAAAGSNETAILVEDEVVLVKKDTSAILGGHALVQNKTNALDALETIFEYKCAICGEVYQGTQVKVAGVKYVKYTCSDELQDYYGDVAGYDMSKVKDGPIYLLDTVPAPEASEKVESAQTFDAGIAMYVGMSVMAAAGSAVVLKKKD